METDKKNSGRRQGSLVSDVVLKSLVSDAVLNCEEKKIESHHSECALHLQRFCYTQQRVLCISDPSLI